MTSALRGGYIAAANHVNIPYEYAWKDPETAKKLAEKTVKDREGMGLKDAAGIKELYKGLDPKKEVVAYCQTGTRSTQTYAVLREAGYQKVRNYDDSWIVWGSDRNLPAKNVSYFNFVKVNKAMKRLEALEKRGRGAGAQEVEGLIGFRTIAGRRQPPFLLPQRACSPRPWPAASRLP